MANPVYAEVAFEALGQKYTYKFGTYAMVVLQKLSGTTTQKFFERIAENAGAADIIMLFQAALARFHPNLSDMEVGDIIDAIGLPRAVEIIQEGLGLSVVKGEDAKGTPNPPQKRKARARS